MNDMKHSFRQYRLPEPGRYNAQSGNINYLDSTDLERPLTMRAKNGLILLVIVIVAAIIGYMFLNSTIFESQRQHESDLQTITETVAREASVNNLPNLAGLTALDDASILAQAQESGAIYDIAAAKGEKGVSYYRFPSGVTAEEGTALYAKGISSLSGVNAAKLLAGGYSLSVSHDAGTTIVARYADFTSSSSADAISAALQAQGIDPASATESGTDDSGNDYQTGSLDANGSTYTWRVSVLPLSDMYSISDLPSSAFYVGIRLQSV